MSDREEIWQVDGVSLAARQAAMTAAADDAMTLGEWIEQAVRDAAQPGAAPVAGASMAEIAAAIDTLSARIAAAEETTRRSVEPLRLRLAELSNRLAEIERAATLFSDGDDTGSADKPTPSRKA